MYKKFFTNTLIYALGPQLPRIASIFVLPIITKDLTATDYGVAGVVMAYTGLFGGFKDLGMVVNLSNLFYRHTHRWKLGWRLIHGYLSFWALPYALIQAGLLFFVMPSEAIENRWPIIMIYSASALIFDTTITFGSRYYQFAQRPFYMAMTAAVVGSLTIFFNLITISYYKMGYMGWFISTLMGTFISFLFYFFPLYFKYKLLPIFRLRRQFIFRQLKVALPMIPHNYSGYLLNTSDRMVMNVLGIRTTQIGIYNIAYSFASYADFIGNAVGMAVGPVYAKLYSLRQEEDVKHLTLLLQSFFLAGSSIVCLWLKEIFNLLIKNEELKTGYYLGIIVIMSYNYRPMYWAVVNKLIFYERTHYLWRISFFGGVVNIILNFILIPLYGFQAAAITTFAGLMYIGFSGFFLKAYQEMHNADYFPIRWLVLIIALTVGVYLLKDTALHFKILISAIISVLGIYIFLKFKSVLNNVRF